MGSSDSENGFKNHGALEFDDIRSRDGPREHHENWKGHFKNFLNFLHSINTTCDRLWFRYVMENPINCYLCTFYQSNRFENYFWPQQKLQILNSRASLIKFFGDQVINYNYSDLKWFDFPSLIPIIKFNSKKCTVNLHFRVLEKMTYTVWPKYIGTSITHTR